MTGDRLSYGRGDTDTAAMRYAGASETRLGRGAAACVVAKTASIFGLSRLFFGDAGLIATACSHRSSAGRDMG